MLHLPQGFAILRGFNGAVACGIENFAIIDDEVPLRNLVHRIAGFQVEYSAVPFVLFFLAEYANMILMSGLTVILFLGGWLPPFDVVPFTWIPGVLWFVFKIIGVLFVFIWVRASFPRYRYDQLMRLGWKVFLPFSLLWVVVTAGASSLPPACGASSRTCPASQNMPIAMLI